MHIGIDVGGTNTDAVLMDGTRTLAGVKHSTTPDVTSGIVQAIEDLRAGHAFEGADIDAANPEFAPLHDLAGVPRPLDGDADGVALSDLGAFEVVHPTADTDGDDLPDAW